MNQISKEKKLPPLVDLFLQKFSLIVFVMLFLISLFYLPEMPLKKYSENLCHKIQNIIRIHWLGFLKGLLA